MAARLSPDDPRYHTGHGGPRIGAGRPPMERPPVHHVRRDPLPRAASCRVTLRVREEIPSLRNPRFVRTLRESLREGADRSGFRVLHFSLEGDEAHFVVEAAHKRALGNGMRSLSARFARAVNRAFERSGPVLYGRYRLRVLHTPVEVRKALASGTPRWSEALVAQPR